MFVIDRNMGIHITQGDTGELDIRLFNKDWHMHREPNNTIKFKMWPLLPLIEPDSEGNPQFVFDSEGIPIYPVDSEGRPIWYDPTMPLPRDSEGNLIIDPSKVIPTEWKHLKRHHFPRVRQIEKLIIPRDQVTLRVIDLATREIVLEKYNDEFANTIFFFKEDTEELEPAFYLYQLIYEPYYRDLDEEDGEKSTVITGIFEVIESFGGHKNA